MKITQKKQIEILRRELYIVRSLPEQILEVLEKKIKYADGQYKKFCDDMIKENSFINRLNASTERQKIRDFKEVAALIVKLAEELPKIGEDGK